MRNVYFILKRSVVAALFLFCQVAMAHPFEHAFSPMAADTLSPDTIPLVIKSFTPTSAKQGTIVAISGLGFTGVTSVFFGSSPANGYTVWNDSLIVAVVGVGSTGSVLVTTSHGSASKPGFTFIRDTVPPVCDTPRIISFTPTSARRGTAVNIFGVHFTGATAVRFGGVLADSIRVSSDSTIRAYVGNGATGSVTVTTPCGTASRPGFTFIRDTVPPVCDTPRIISFTPISARRGTAVNIFGVHFTGATAVRFGGVLADSIWVLSDSTIRAKVSTGATGNVTVTTPCGSASRPGFTFIRDTVPPVCDTPRIISFTPTSARRGTAVNIFGVHFTGATAVRFGGVLADSIWVLSDSTIRAYVGNGTTGSITVTTPCGTASKPGFTFIRDTVIVCDTPQIISFTPTSARRGDIVNIFGVRFTGATAVRFGGTLADSIWVLSDSTIRAKVGSGSTGYVTVTTCGSYSRPGFTFIRDTVPPVCDTPRIISFTPTSGIRRTVVTISGVRFTGATAVRFGGVLADSIIIYSDSIIKAFVGNGAAGNVSVTTPCGTASRPGFTFIPNVPDTTIHDSIPPHIYSFFPTHAKNGDTVYIRGHYFLFVNAVKFGGVPAKRFLVHSDTLIRAVVDNGASGAVSVSSSIGLSAKNGFTFIPDSTGTPDSLARMVVGNTNSTVDSKLFALYPNPASGYAIWQQPATDHITNLQLVDINGRLIKTISLGKNAIQTTISVSGLPIGMYKLVWSDGKNKVAKSLLIK
jgi:hypothetical protein